MRKLLCALLFVFASLNANAQAAKLHPETLGAAKYPTLSNTCTGTQNWNMNNQLISNAKLTTTGACTLTVSNLVLGGSYVLVLTQGSGGSLTLGSGCTWRVSNGGAGAVNQTSTSGAIDILAFTYDGAYCYANFAPNYS